MELSASPLHTSWRLILATTGSSITIADNYATLFQGASGQADGVLGDYGFEVVARPLGLYSWQLHQQLAREHDGRGQWGFSDIVIHNLTSKSSTEEEPSQTSSHPLPFWLNTSHASLGDYVDSIINDADHNAARL